MEKIAQGKKKLKKKWMIVYEMKKIKPSNSKISTKDYSSIRMLLLLHGRVTKVQLHEVF